MESQPQIPTLDGRKFFAGSDAERRGFANDLTNSFKRFGFVKLVNHGVPDDTITELFGWMAKFYRLSQQQKLKAVHPPGPNPQRGWSGIGVETTSSLYGHHGEKPTGALKDSKEHYDIGPQDDTEFPNRWPDEADVPGWRAFMESYYDLAQRISLEIMRALEIGLEIPTDSLVSRCVPNASELRLNHYPEVPIKELQAGDTARIWPHTDFGLITLLFQDDAGGLEVEDQQKPGSYIPVRREAPNEMIVNISACFERWTNGVIRAGVHRVTIPWDRQAETDGSLAERWSAAHLFKAQRSAMVGPLPWFVSTDRPAMFDDIDALQFQRRRTGLVYSEGQVAA